MYILLAVLFIKVLLTFVLKFLGQSFVVVECVLMVCLLVNHQYVFLLQTLFTNSWNGTNWAVRNRLLDGAVTLLCGTG